MSAPVVFDLPGAHVTIACFARNRDTVFPWARVVTSGDDADKWARFVGMRRKLASDRFLGVPAASSEAA